VTRLLFIVLALPACFAQAAEVDLSKAIAQGKWSLAYQRNGELKPLKYKRTEEGVSYTCIEGDPRTKILDWLAGKGCTVHDETMEKGVYRMRGECTLKWWRGQSIPAMVTLRPQSKDAFTLDINAQENPLLGYDEHTQANLIGPCDPASTTQGSQNQGNQAQGTSGK